MGCDEIQYGFQDCCQNILQFWLSSHNDGHSIFSGSVWPVLWMFKLKMNISLKLRSNRQLVGELSVNGAILIGTWAGKMNLLLLWLSSCWFFTAHRHFSGHFGCSQFTYPHCSWASLLGSLPVLSAHYFAGKWHCPSWIRGREREAVEIICWTWGSSLRPSANQVDMHPTKLACPAKMTWWESSLS